MTLLSSSIPSLRRTLLVSFCLLTSLLSTFASATYSPFEPMMGETQGNNYPSDYTIRDLQIQQYKFRQMTKVVITGKLTHQNGNQYLFTDQTGSLPIVVKPSAFQGNTTLPKQNVEIVARYKAGGEAPIFEAVSVSKIK